MDNPKKVSNNNEYKKRPGLTLSVNTENSKGKRKKKKKIEMSGEEALIGSIDQGTTSTRFIIYDRSKKPVASHQLEYTQLSPQLGYSFLSCITLFSLSLITKSFLCLCDFLYWLTTFRSSFLVWQMGGA